ncbi:MAG: hypothetical protein IJO77_07695 [Oscillospiraceae bacterium]|nr:hypothetical protein [Oscillospiraceae bacterium]
MNSKVYVGVNAMFEPDGRLLPLSILWEDGRIFEIDRILDVRRAASLKAGGSGIRYTVRIGSHETFLFLEEGRWFAERRF